jgi:hypothetical protein
MTGVIAANIGVAVTPSSSLDGLAIARECLAKEAEEKTGFLDLGNLGLTELPEELFRLKHLRRLSLGPRIPTRKGNGGPACQKPVTKIRLAMTLAGWPN